MSDFHAVNMVGPFKVERLTARPVWTSSDIGREIYVSTLDTTYGGKYWKGTESGWIDISLSTHNHTGVYLPLTGKAADSDLLDGLDSTAYAQLTIPNNFSATVNLQDNVLQRPEIKDYAETFVDTGSGQDYTFDLTNGNNFQRVVTGNSVYTFTNPPGSGKIGSFTLFLINGGSYTITWPSSVTWPNNNVPNIGANTTSLVDIFTFVTCTGGARWYGNMAIKKLPI